MTSQLSVEEIKDYDEKLQQLYECKCLPENDVKTLCDKVSSNPRPRKSSVRSLMCNLCGVLSLCAATSTASSTI